MVKIAWHCNKARKLYLVINMDIFASNFFKNLGLMLYYKNSFFSCQTTTSHAWFTFQNSLTDALYMPQKGSLWRPGQGLCIWGLHILSTCAASQPLPQEEEEKLLERAKYLDQFYNISYMEAVDILFSSNHNIHKILLGHWFWPSNPLIDIFYSNLHIN